MQDVEVSAQVSGVGIRRGIAGSFAGAGIERHLGAVRVAVEKCEQADEPHGDSERGPASESHHAAEHDNRDGDADFDERQREASHAERGARDHDEDEGRRHEDERTAAELPSQDADGHHGENVIEPAERMRESRRETVHVTRSRKRECGGRNKRESGGDQPSAHGISLSASITAASLHIGGALDKSEWLILTPAWEFARVGLIGTRLLTRCRSLWKSGDQTSAH